MSTSRCVSETVQHVRCIRTRPRGSAILVGCLLCLTGLAPTAQAQAPLPSGELLVDACFPTSTVLHAYSRSPGNPWLAGEWNAENAIIIGSDAGITPFEGNAMLRVNAVGGFVSQVSQIVDVSAWATEIDAGMVLLASSVQVNAAVATAAPSMLVIAGTSQTVVGTLNPVGGSIIQGFNRATLGITTDADPATWERLRIVLALPGGTRFLHYEVAGANATLPPSGVFFDCGTVELLPRLLGDMNCDGVVDFFDIDAFLLALFDPAGYAAAFPGCDRDSADVNGDGVVDFFDIDSFLDCLFGACP